MKRIVVLFMLLFPAVEMGFAQKQIVLDEYAEPVTVSGVFNAIQVSDGLEVYLSQSDVVSMAASTGAEGCAKSIAARVEDSVLHLSFEGLPGCKYGRKKAIAYLSFNNLNSISVKNGSEVKLVGIINAESLRIQLSAGSEFDGEVEANDLWLNLADGSDMKISGKAKQVNIESNGASDVDGFELTAENCNVTAGGASDISITVTNLLKASARGASDISYKGNAKLEKVHSSGSSNISKKD